MTGSRVVRQAALLSWIVGIVAGCGEEAPVEPDTSDTDAGAPLELGQGGGLPFADSEIFFEFNSTDNDLGVQVFLDAEDWSRVKIFAPDGRSILDIRGESELGELGLTELFFESAEPSPGEVLALFDPGEYTFVGRTTEGERLFGTGMLSHDLPPAPVFSPSNGEVLDHTAVVIRWDPIPGAARFEVIVSDEINAANIEAEVSGGTSEMAVPPTFLAPGGSYKAEVLAIFDNGNKTISEGLFYTLP
jgi:hypothetical protein